MTMDDRDGVIWMDGHLVPWREAKVHVLTHSLHYGMGVFEGVRAYATERGPAIFRVVEHTARLLRSAHIVRMACPFDHNTLLEAQRMVVRENGFESCYLRPLLYYGAEGLGLKPKGLKVHAAVAAWPWGAYLSEEGVEKGIRVQTSSFSRHHVNSAMCKAKVSGQYFNSVLAAQDAISSGFDEALLLDVEGFVAEGSGENLFLIRDGLLYTPELTSVLEGITRHTILTLAKDEEIQVVVKRLTRDEVYSADEAFFTGTAAEVTPIREVDHRTIGSGKPGPFTQKIQALYQAIVHGKVQKYHHWLDFLRS